MIRRPPRSTRTATLLPYTSLFRYQHVELFTGIEPPIDLYGHLNIERSCRAFDPSGRAYIRVIFLIFAEAFFEFIERHTTCAAFILPEFPCRFIRSVERRVWNGCGSMCRYRWTPAPYRKKKNR